MLVKCSLAQQQGLKGLIISVNKQNKHSFLKGFFSLEIFVIVCWLISVCETLAFLWSFKTPKPEFLPLLMNCGDDL